MGEAIIITEDMIAISKHSSTVLVYALIAHFHLKQPCVLSYNDFATKLNISKSTAKRSIKELIDNHYIKSTPLSKMSGKFLANLYGIEGDIKVKNNERHCFLCKRVETEFRHCEVHHIFQNGNRNNSEKYGATVILCADCHRLAPHAAHRSGKTMEYLYKYGQRKVMQEQGWTVDEFRGIFGANYLDDNETL